MDKKNYFKNWKCPTFDGSASSCLTRYEKIIFRKIKLILRLKDLLWKLKMSNFWQVCLNLSHKIQKILWRGSLGCKKLLKFTCLTMKFHNCHHTSTHLDFLYLKAKKSDRKITFFTNHNFSTYFYVLLYRRESKTIRGWVKEWKTSV